MPLERQAILVLPDQLDQQVRLVRLVLPDLRVQREPQDLPVLLVQLVLREQQAQQGQRVLLVQRVLQELALQQVVQPIHF